MPYELHRRFEALRPFLPDEYHSPVARYGAALLCAAGAALLRRTAEPLLGTQAPFILFFPAILLASRFGGLRPGALCTLLCAWAAWGARAPDPRFEANLVLFAVLGLLISVLNESLLRASQVLRLSLQRTTEILESVSDGFYVLDAEFRFTYVNGAAEKAWGKRRAELLGRSIWEVFPVVVGSEVHAAHLEAARTRLPKRLEVFSPVVKRWLDVSLHPSASALSVYFHDISERRRRREELERLVERRTSRLREVNEELETFTYSASHDLRAPARKIRGYSDLLRRRHAGALPEEGLLYLDRIRASTTTMVRVIDEMRSLAEATQRELRREDVDLSAIARRWCAERSAAETGRRVTCDIAPGLTARGDPPMLELALHQLLDNAWKFTRPRKHARVELGRAAGKDRVFYVKDDGVGFDMAHQSKLFRPFERLHDTGAFDGAGVGLAIVQRIVRRHGGEAWAESRPGEGATFYFSLPEGT
jgi:PAS domain S-box-containing protein